MSNDKNYQAALNADVNGVAIESGSVKDYYLDYLIENFGRCALGINK